MSGAIAKGGEPQSTHAELPPLALAARDLMSDYNFISYPVALTYRHLEISINQYANSMAVSGEAWSWIQQAESALSSILHAFFAFETSVNMLGHERFFNKNSDFFIAPDSRSLLLRKFVSRWQIASCIDKYELLADLDESINLDSRHLAELREVNTLRNKLAHGFVYQTYILTETSGLEVVREDDVDWRRMFPHLGIEFLDRLNHENAKKVLEVCLHGYALASWMRKVAPLLMSHTQRPVTTIGKEGDDGIKLLADHMLARLPVVSSNPS